MDALLKLKIGYTKRMVWFLTILRAYSKRVRVALLLCLFFSVGVTAQESLRVGVYHNPPFSHTDLEGGPDGFVVGLLRHIAELEGWPMTFVTCNWDECNELLRLGEIQMLSPISANESRQRRLDFNRESIYVNWGQIVMEGKDEIRSPLDLEGKTVVALSSDTHFADLKELANRFDIQVRFLEVGDYDSVLAWVAEGPVDAGLVSRSVDTRVFGESELIKSSVIFNPAEIRVAFSPLNGQLSNARRMQRLDYHLTQLKGDPESRYYQLQRRWFGHVSDFEMPKWLLWLLIFIGLLLLFLALGVVLLRRQVRAQTVSLHAVNDRFAAFMNHLPGIAYMKETDGRFVFVNSAWQKLNGLLEERVKERLPMEIWPERNLPPLAHCEQSAIDGGVAVESQDNHPWGDTPSEWQITHFPIHDATGEVTMVGGIGIDVTTLREAEQALSALNQQQQLILESAGDGILGLNGAGYCTFVNQAALEMLSFQRDELVGGKFHDLVMHSLRSGEISPERKSPVYKAYRLGKRFRGEQVAFWGGEGSAMDVEYSAYPIADDGLSGAVVIFRTAS